MSIKKLKMNMNKSYKCDRCGYSTDVKGSFKRHIYKKILCKNKLSDTDIKTIREKFEQGEEIKDLMKEMEEDMGNDEDCEVVTKEEVVVSEDGKNIVTTRDTTRTKNVNRNVNITINNYDSGDLSYITEEYIGWIQRIPIRGSEEEYDEWMKEIPEGAVLPGEIIIEEDPETSNHFEDF